MGIIFLFQFQYDRKSYTVGYHVIETSCKSCNLAVSETFYVQP